MSFLKYLKNRTIFFLALIASSTLIGFMLKGVGLNVFAIAYLYSGFMGSGNSCTISRLFSSSVGFISSLLRI